jgi:hypothetical protein
MKHDTMTHTAHSTRVVSCLLIRARQGRVRVLAYSRQRTYHIHPSAPATAVGKHAPGINTHKTHTPRPTSRKHRQPHRYGSLAMDNHGRPAAICCNTTAKCLSGGVACAWSAQAVSQQYAHTLTPPAFPSKHASDKAAGASCRWLSPTGRSGCGVGQKRSVAAWCERCGL